MFSLLDLWFGIAVYFVVYVNCVLLFGCWSLWVGACACCLFDCVVYVCLLYWHLFLICGFDCLLLFAFVLVWFGYYCLLCLDFDLVLGV